MDKGYKEFISKYRDKITNIPTLEDVAKFYLEKINEIDFSDIDEVYDYLSDVRELSGNDEANLLVSLSDIDENLHTILVRPYTDRSFISFSNPNYDLYCQRDNQLKLWIDAKLENIPEIAIRLAEKIDSRLCKHISDKEATVEITRLKISKCLHRNDTLTIYTDYSCADQIIQDLIEMKNENPELFESESRANPFVMKINGFISYADVDHYSSYPELLSNIYFEVNKSREQILSYPADKRLDYVKISILNAIKAEFYYDKKTILANPENMASTRVGDGILVEDLSKEQRDGYVDSIDQMQIKLINNIQSEME